MFPLPFNLDDPDSKLPPFHIRPVFTVYQALGYTGIPFSVPGMRRINLLYESMLYQGADLGQPPPMDNLVGWIQALKSANYRGPLILDIEHWPIYMDPTYVRHMMNVAKAFQTLGPWPIGYYGMVPERDSVRSLLSKDSAGFQVWQWRNNRVHGLAETVDILCPSLYTQLTDPTQWLVFAKRTVDECHRYDPDKPVVPFIWAKYHDGMGAPLGGTYLPQSYWALMLRFVYKYCDGVVIWSESSTDVWDPTIAWYQTFLAFRRNYMLS